MVEEHGGDQFPERRRPTIAVLIKSFHKTALYVASRGMVTARADDRGHGTLRPTATRVEASQDRIHSRLAGIDFRRVLRLPLDSFRIRACRRQIEIRQGNLLRGSSSKASPFQLPQCR